MLYVCTMKLIIDYNNDCFPLDMENRGSLKQKLKKSRNILDYYQQCSRAGQPAEGGRGHLGANEALSGAATAAMGQLPARKG